MYRIALIQNESEMMRYSWADIRPMVERLGYGFDGFTAENIEDLIPRLKTDQYDAIIIASNACNDKAVRESLERHRTAIDDFLKEGKGLLVSFQMRMADFKFYGFLADPLRISAVNRIYAGEMPQDGDLVASEHQVGHTVLCYPNKVDLVKVKAKCLSNNLVEGLYWTYLVSEHPQNYVTLIEDRTHTPPRPLLIACREDLRYRVIISSLALDWQQNDELWENAARYVVEGRPSVAVISKSGSSLFDFRYLISTLEITKLPYAEYIQETIAPDKVALDVHDIYILDPAWSERDVDSFIEANSARIDAGQARIFYFSRTGQGRLILEVVSNVREYQIIARNAITWLISQFPDEQDQGYWGGSFWYTVDVLSTLVGFGIPVTQFKEKILKAVEKHDRNGSYDEVLGATCAMFEVYSLFLGKGHAKTRRALEWILAHVYNRTLFEQATAYDVLTRLGVELPLQKLSEFKDEVMRSPTLLDNEFAAYRYARTLLTCGFAKEAEQVAMHLENLQDSVDGKWVNIPNTAVIVELLVDIQKTIGRPKHSIDEMIFKGIRFIRSTYTPTEFSWKSDISATAKSIKALRAFEQRISFPIDVVVTALQSGVERARDYIAIEAASGLNIRLQNRVNDLMNQLDGLRRSVKTVNRRSAFAVRLSIVSTVIIALGVTFGLLFIGYLARNNLLSEAWVYIKTFVSESAVVVLPALAVVPLVILIYVLRRLGKLPKWLVSLLSPVIKLDKE